LNHNNTINAFNWSIIPTEIVRDNIISYFDPMRLTKTVKTMEKESKEKRNKSKKKEDEHPGGGRYARGRSKKNKKTKNKKDLEKFL
jgi:hypothetical protein